MIATAELDDGDALTACRVRWNAELAYGRCVAGLGAAQAWLARLAFTGFGLMSRATPRWLGHRTTSRLMTAMMTPSRLLGTDAVPSRPRNCLFSVV